jgi:hypothetical protein
MIAQINSSHPAGVIYKPFRLPQLKQVVWQALG